MPSTQQARDIAARNYKERRAAGLCARCGINPSVPAYCAECKVKINARSREAYRTNPQYRDRERSTNKHSMIRLRESTINAYGGSCVCCGEDRMYFLQLDHINGGGRRHAKECGGVRQMHRVLRDQGYPPILQVLCANCHMAKTYIGRCPCQD